jgi:hypothetical protein
MVELISSSKPHRGGRWVHKAESGLYMVGELKLGGMWVTGHRWFQQVWGIRRGACDSSVAEAIELISNAQGRQVGCIKLRVGNKLVG